MKSFLSIALVAFICVAAGCRQQQGAVADESDLVKFTTTEDTYAPDDTVTLRLESNTSDQTLEYNLCFSTLERETDEGWMPARLPNGEEVTRVCTAIAHLLEPGEMATYPIALDERLKEGAYRFTSDVRISQSTEDIGVSTPSFRIDSE